MNVRYISAGNHRPSYNQAIKLHTVNVIEFTNGDLQSIRSFADNAKGNKRAEKLFKQLVREYEDGNTEVSRASDADDMEDYLGDGIYQSATLTSTSGYQLLLTHSIS